MQIGKYIKQPSGYKAFTLDPFPPESGFQFSSELIKLASEATLFLGKLDGITHLLPDVDFFIYMYKRKDAASSSQIEGTQATMVDAIEAESKTSTKLPEDVDDILFYLKAMNYGLDEIGNLPMSLRFIKNLHKQLLDGARATHFADPGNFRKSQNWIGGTSPENASFVPPSPRDMLDALSNLEKFLHSEDSILPVIKAGLIHAQFETIHPFLDGNGRTGRLLITFYLLLQNLLEKPVLFLSWYFKINQKVYYQRLEEYHNGNVEKWLMFFLEGIISVSKEAIQTVHKITVLRDDNLVKINLLGKTASESTLTVLPELYKLPIVNVANIVEWTGFTRQGAQKVIDRFIDLGILTQKDENEVYGKSYIFHEYVNIFKD